jgi:hypothetical protein
MYILPLNLIVLMCVSQKMWSLYYGLPYYGLAFCQVFPIAVSAFVWSLLFRRAFYRLAFSGR